MLSKPASIWVDHHIHRIWKWQSEPNKPLSRLIKSWFFSFHQLLLFLFWSRGKWQWFFGSGNLWNIDLVKMAWRKGCEEVANSKPLFLTIYTVVIIGIVVSSFFVFSAIYSTNPPSAQSSAWLSSISSMCFR